MTPAVREARAAGIEHRLHEFRHDPRATGWGEEAAAALGVEPARVFKTLVVALPEDALALAVIPVAARLDVKALARVLGVRQVALADPATAERATGCVVGGISPWGLRRSLPAVVDESAAGHETVLVSAGRRGLEIELAPDDLLALSGGRLAPVARSVVR